MRTILAHQQRRSSRQSQSTKMAQISNSQVNGAKSGMPLFMKQNSAIQTKLTVNPANDAYEQEADRVADQVASSPSLFNATPSMKREGVQRDVQLKSESTESSVAALSNTGLENTLASKRGGGSPLPDAVKGGMESRIGYDFSNVRIHTDQDAVQLNQGLGAQAFTHGVNIFFGSGKFNPHATSGQHLLAHELTHVIQQTGGIQTKRSPDQPQIQLKCADCEEEDRIQRSPDFPPKLQWGDWEFKPKPEDSTDDHLDTPENRRRAEMKDADERSNDPTPNEWWKTPKVDPFKPPKGCPTERWNWVFNTCCPENQHKDPNSPNCISNTPLPPTLRPNDFPMPPDEKGDFPLPDPDQKYA